MTEEIIQEVRDLEDCKITSENEFDTGDETVLSKEVFIESETPEEHREVLKELTKETDWDVDRFTQTNAQPEGGENTLYLVKFAQ